MVESGALLEVKGLVSGFGSGPVLFGIDMDIREGELIALIGSNGAGKSTLLGTLTGLVPPMARPRLLAIDELSLGLAPKIVERLLEVVQEINRDGTGVLLVEQDVLVALEVAHRGFVVENGRVVLHGPCAELMNDPKLREAYLG